MTIDIFTGEYIRDGENIRRQYHGNFPGNNRTTSFGDEALEILSSAENKTSAIKAEAVKDRGQEKIKYF